MKTIEELTEKWGYYSQERGCASEDVPSDSLRRECDQIYRAAWDRVDRIAEHMDQVNALLPRPFEQFDLTDVFVARDRSLIDQIENEWLKDKPDLEKFKELVSEWEANCMIELKAWLDKMRDIPERG